MGGCERSQTWGEEEMNGEKKEEEEWIRNMKLKENTRKHYLVSFSVRGGDDDDDDDEDDDNDEEEEE
ncbi:hypothetical protein ElyMa_003670800 [Elysia marginata]|uniref:Uncharacterized protein n=1 Tax=Elysia marginata TaxID=1093978 RepID=A0AAV4EZH3_9GAST|nr:hypothetical protein ElyMa_003670800 [Elysia marginata]